MKKEHNTFIKSALTVSAGGFIAKILGAVYRIPLTNILGSEGIGLYQMVFPLYCVLLTISSTGIPSSISKIISETDSKESVLRSSARLFGTIGFFGTFFMCLFCALIAKLQGNILAWRGYVALSPSVFLVSLISCLRGYFQGGSDMRPTATSQIIEQLVKLILGLSLSLIFRGNLVLAVTMSVMAVSVSELVALLYLLYIKRVRSDFPKTLAVETFPKRRLISVVFPVTLSAILIPLSRVFDSFLSINIISAYSSDATKLYGLYSGGVESIIGVPVSICYGIPVALIPIVSSAYKRGEYEKCKKNTDRAILYTFLLSAFFAVAVALLSRPAVSILYFALDGKSKEIMIGLLRLSSVTVLLLSCVQTFNAVYISENKLYLPSLFLCAGIAVKIIVLFVLLRIQKINIFAVAISDILCYIVACFCDLGYYIIDNVKLRRKNLSVSRKKPDSAFNL